MRDNLKRLRDDKGAVGIVVLVFSLWQFDHTGDTGLEKLGKLGNVIASPVVS